MSRDDDAPDALALVDEALDHGTIVYSLSLTELEDLARELRWFRSAVAQLNRHALGGEGTDLAGAVAMVREFARARGIALSANPEQACADLRAAFVAANARALATLTAARPN